MADQARKQTDKILSDMEKEVRSIYDRASADISAKWYKYMESHEKSLKSAYNALQEALKSGDNDAIAKAKSDYERILKNVTLNNDKYKAMLNETTAKLSHTNEVALDYVNGNMAKIYTLNYNEFANQDITGYTFTLVNEQAVKNLATEDKSLLPKKKVDIPKDKLWNQKNINSEVLQGILQGENITKIADRLQHVTDMNEKSAIRNARTMVTSAENKGRQDSFKKAESDGVVMIRRWVATHDERTRAWHTDLDGVEVGLDEPWTNEYGEIMYPGDPSADPANVYNCRCSIRSIVQGFKRNEEEVPDEVPDEVPEEVPVETNVVQGKDLSGIWERRPDEFDFEIDDIIDAQGFNGLPRVVDADEFDRAIKESNIIMQRGYTAPDEETLKAYQDQLYNGKWYIDCSTGGHMYGRGMYADGTFGTKVNESMEATMKAYGAGPNGKIETFTLTSDAKILDYKDVDRLRREYGQDTINRIVGLEKLSDEERIFAYSQMGMTNTEDTIKAMNWASNNSDKVKDIYTKYVYPYNKEIGEIRNEVFSMDEGVLATLKGYDAINCENIVEGDSDGYFIILNRTKCIFKGE